MAPCFSFPTPHSKVTNIYYSRGTSTLLQSYRWGCSHSCYRYGGEFPRIRTFIAINYSPVVCQHRHIYLLIPELLIFHPFQQMQWKIFYNFEQLSWGNWVIYVWYRWGRRRRSRNEFYGWWNAMLLMYWGDRWRVMWRYRYGWGCCKNGRGDC